MIQTQIVTTCNNTTVKGNNLKSKSNNQDRDFPKILKVLFSFNLRWIALFFTFQILKALHKFEFKCLMFHWLLQMSFKNFLCWYQLSQTNLERKIFLKIMKFYKISTVKICVIKVIILRKLINFQSHVFKYASKTASNKQEKVSGKNTKGLKGSR